mmetsp:Transcript_49721/g.146960  ORF Transcript_49721/g.146960 Transcript_49721/m.146960 type:complete len:280 (+) Transcript_49721:1225-2064(+)
MKTLLHVQVRGGLIEHVHLRVLDAEDSDGEALQLSAGEVLDLALLQVGKLELLVVVVHHLLIVLLAEDLPDLARDLLRDLVDVLRLDHRLQAILQKALDVRLQLAAPEVLQDLLPVRGRVEAAEVRLQLAGQHVERGRLADAVGADEAEHLAWPGDRQPVQLEGVRAVAVRRVGAQVLRQVDDGNRLEGALLHADTATDAERLGDPGDLRVLADLNAELPGAHDGAKLLALLLALLRLASVRVHDGDTQPLFLLLTFLPHRALMRLVQRGSLWGSGQKA